VEWLLEEVHGQQGLLTFFEGDGTSKVLDDDLRIILFQAVRELVANVVKHAHAGWVMVSVTGNGKTIRVAVEDNGVGFDVSEATSQTHKRHTFGLFNVRERLEYQGGALDIQSIPGRGTKVVLTARLKS